MRKNVLISPRLSKLKKRRRIIIIFKIILAILAVLAFFAGLIFLSRVSILNIREIKVIGNKVMDAQTIEAVARKEIEGNYLWFFPKTNILFYPKDNIENSLEVNFTRFQDIKISIKENKILEINLVERVGKYTWCGNVIPESGSDSGEGCYFMDENGYIFDRAPYFSGEVYFKFYGHTDSDSENPLGSYFLKDSFDELIILEKTIKGLGLKPVVLYKKDAENIGLYLSNGNSASMGPEILFKADSDFQAIVENLETAVTSEPLKSNLKNKYSSLEYIDLRFGNKVYYRFR